jgi:hypothetical protein
MTFRLKYDPTPENAAAFAADIAAATLRISGVELDYSRESLTRVDAVIEDLRSGGPPAEQIAETLFGFGCYVGEVMVRRGGGRWDAPTGTDEEAFAGYPLVVGSRLEAGPIRSTRSSGATGKGRSISSSTSTT